MPRYQVLSSRHPLSFNVPTVWGSALTHGYINKHHRPQRLTLFPATPCWLQHILISLISRCSSRFLMQLKKMPIRREFWRLLSEASFMSSSFYFPKLLQPFSVMFINWRKTEELFGERKITSHLIMVIHYLQKYGMSLTLFMYICLDIFLV